MRAPIEEKDMHTKRRLERKKERRGEVERGGTEEGAIEG
jgi:hypothetical protein